MKLIMVDFLCDRCQEMFEKLVESDTQEHDCPDCGSVAKRVISPVNLDYLGSDLANMPTFEAKFDRMHREKAKSERKQQDS